MAEGKCTDNNISACLEKDASYGIIPLRKKENDWEVFIIKHKAGHLGFPKGHLINSDEKPKDAAERELQEETGLIVEAYYSFEPIHVNYECISHGKHVDKLVTFFAAKVGGDVHLGYDEIDDGSWLKLGAAYKKLQFDSMKKIVEKLQKILMGNTEVI